MLDGRTILKLNDDVILKSVNNSFRALNVNDGNQYRLNLVSFKMLENDDGKRNIDDIVNELTKIFDVEKTTLKDDILLFYSEALQKKIIFLVEIDENN